MMQVDTTELLPIGVALGASLLLTPAVIATARRVGMVAQPKADRWHRKPTAMLGGVAVMLATAAGFCFAHPSPRMWAVFAASLGMCVLGLVDDILHIKPYQKLVVQLLGAAAVVAVGLVLPWTSSITLNMVVTMFWLIGITNALNLLDNMDGLAAGIAVIASCFLGLSFLYNAQPAEATIAFTFAAALTGFLVYNFNPASVFMGDCGSMFIGFFLASSALLATAGTGARTRSFLPILAVPILIFAIPIFDTTFVTVMRKLAGRAASQGGRDHTSHRLVGLGMSERRAVLMLYAFAILSGMVALGARNMHTDVSMALTTTFVLALTIGGVHLAGVKVYTDEMAIRPSASLHTFLVDLSYKRRIFEVLLDAVLVVLAYYLSYLSLFGPFSPTDANWELFLQTTPLMVGSVLVASLATGVYRGVWRYTSLSDVATIARAVLVGSLISMVCVGFVFRFAGFSRAVFAINAMYLVGGMVAGRLSFRVLKRRRPVTFSDSHRRVMIYGAGDAGERLLRELRQNIDLTYVPVGFLDDDDRMVGRVIHGLRVMRSAPSAAAVCRQLGADEIIISSTGFSAQRLNEIWAECKPHGIQVSRVRFQIEHVQAFVPTIVQLADQAPHGDKAKVRRVSADHGPRATRE